MRAMVDKAMALLMAVQNELSLGTRHWNQAGKLLTTPLQIVGCLLDEGMVTFEPTPARRDIFRGYVLE